MQSQSRYYRGGMGGQQGVLQIELPLKIALTAAGTDFFIRNNRRVDRVNLAGHGHGFGLEVSGISEPALERLVSEDFVSKIEVGRSSFLDDRKDLRRLSNLIFETMVLRRFDGEMRDRILSSAAYRDRARRGVRVDFATADALDPGAVREFLRKNQAAVARISEHIVRSRPGDGGRGSSFSDEDRKIKRESLQRLVDGMSDSIWYVLLHLLPGNNRSELIPSLRVLVHSYSEKIDISDHLTSVLVELVNRFQTENMKVFAAKVGVDETRAGALILDERVRRQLKERMDAMGHNLYIDWHLRSTTAHGASKGSAIVIRIFDTSARAFAIKQKIEEKKEVSTEAKSLKDFYDSLPAGEDNLDLGLFYLSYLNDLCKRQGIYFNSQVSALPEANTSVVSMTLYF